MSLIAVGYPQLQPVDLGVIQSIRCKHEPNYRLLDPHVTLLFPVEGLESDSFQSHIEPIVRATAPIEFTMRSASLVKAMDVDEWYLLLTPDEGFSQIVKLHDRLYSGPFAPQLRREIPFIPHITLGRFDEWAPGQTLRDELNSKDLAICGRLESLQAIAWQPPEINVVADIPFARV